jgi:hypothetical protein
VEISLDQSFAKQSTTSDASFVIVQQEHVIGPSITVRAISDNERHKEKKRKKKEKKEKKEKEREGKSEERKKRHHKEKEEERSKDPIEENHLGKDQGIDENVHRSEIIWKFKSLTETGDFIAEQQLKVPKIKIRIGPSPNAVSTAEKHEPALLSVQPTSTAPIIDLGRIEQTVKEKTPVSSQIENTATSTTISAILTESKSPNEPIITIANTIQPLTSTPMLIPPLRIAKSPEKGMRY